MIGESIAHYRITGKLGAGGMGEVYRATDTKLGREVALKILPAAFAQDVERMARFAREAQVLAVLNHPHIAAIYGVEERAIVMELVEGANLAGPLPLETAVHYARQIAEALEAAHEKGIVHRDLKPANIKITPEGNVKVLDFGLASAAQGGASGAQADSPTLTLSPTRTGVILGTAGYMSPEQARGTAADKRADIWSYGVVLFEMLTGRPTFAGVTISDTLAAVLRADLNWSALPADTPPNIRRLLRRCLERDRKRRLRDIADARLELDEPAESPSAAAQAPPSKRRLLPWGLAAVLLAAAVWLAVSRGTGPQASVHSFILPPEKAAFRPLLGSSGGIAISPDGRTLAFVATQDGRTLLWVRPLDSLAARPLPGTENAYDPFWSPDSRSLGFFADPKLKKVDVAGGPAQVVCDATSGRGGTWNLEGTIVISSTRGLFRVPAAGGQPVQIADRTAGEARSWSWFLPDGRHFLYLARSRVGGGIIRVGSIDQISGTDPALEQLQSELNSMYVPGPGRAGWILFVRQGTLFAQNFDARKFKLEGEAVPVAESVSYVPGLGYAGFSVSQTGVLAYSPNVGLSGRLVFLNREGKPYPVAAPPGAYQQPRLSPDGARLAVSIVDATGHPDIWLIDLAHDGVPMRFTFEPGPNLFPLWSPDGRQIAFGSSRAEGAGIYVKAANGAGIEEPIAPTGLAVATYDWSRSGRYILHLGIGATTGPDLWSYDLKERKSSPIVQTQFNESQGQFSPDGRWVAYSSDESTRSEVYVRSFAGPPSKFQISVNGGGQPRWRGDGKELYYISPDGKMMAVTVKAAADTFEREAPRVLFESRALAGALGSGPQGYVYDVTRDGQRFLMIDHVEEGNNRPLILITNWQARLKR